MKFDGALNYCIQHTYTEWNWHSTTQTDTVGAHALRYSHAVWPMTYVYIWYILYGLRYDWTTPKQAIQFQTTTTTKVFLMNFLCRDEMVTNIARYRTWRGMVWFDLHTHTQWKCTRHQNLKSHKTHLQFVRTNHSNMFHGGKGNGNGVDVWFSFRVDIKSNWLYTILSRQSH